MDSGSPPQQPDPIATANAQGTANIDAARVTTALNRANQYTPYGNLTWTQGAPTRTFNQSAYDDAMKQYQTGVPTAPGTPGSAENNWARAYGTPTMQPNTGPAPDRNSDQFYTTTPSDQWSSTITLDPRVQGLVDAELSTDKAMQGSINQGLNQVNQTFAGPAPTADAASRQRTEDALYGRQTSRLDPQYQQQEQQLRSDLMNRGIVEGSDAWNQQMDQFQRGKNDAYQQARDSSITGGGNEEAQQLQMQLEARNNVLNALSSLRTGAQVQAPQFGQTPSGATVNPAPVAQSLYNNYQGALGQYGANVASSNATMGALGTAGAGVLGGLASSGALTGLIAMF